jgi:CBS-domain-containing membrane protein
MIASMCAAAILLFAAANSPLAQAWSIATANLLSVVAGADWLAAQEQMAINRSH